MISLSLPLIELAAGSTKPPAAHSEWSSLFDDVLDPSTGLPLMGHPVPPLSPLGSSLSPTVPHVDSWVLEETKKLEAQQRIQQRKLLDLKQVCINVCVFVSLHQCLCVCIFASVCRLIFWLELLAGEKGVKTVG